LIHLQHSEAVFSMIEDLLDDLGPADEYRALFAKALTAVRAAADASEIFIPIDLPMAVADVIGRSQMEGAISAAASTLLWAGADLMDDAADGELGQDWDGVSRSQIALVSTNLLSTLPHLLVGGVDFTDGAVSAAYSQAVSRTLFVMSEGQSADLDSPRSVRTIDDYMALVRRKTGAEFALFASTPAILAGADDETIGAWVKFGFAYGAMSQVFSDTVSSVNDGTRSDLRNGKRTLPVLHTLAQISDDDRTSLARDLDLAARGDDPAVSRVIDAMTSAGAIRFSLERIEVLRFRAAQALPVKISTLAPTHAIRSLMGSCSLL